MIGDSLAEVTWGAFSVARAVEALARQPQLLVPAKIVSRPGCEAEILIEVPRGAGPESQTLQNGIVSTVRSWIAGGSGAPSCSYPAPAPDNQSLEEMVSALGWESRDQNGHGLMVVLSGTHSGRRLWLSQAECGMVHLSLASRSLKVQHWMCTKAMATFTLEANLRIRMARASIRPVGSSVAIVTFDTVLPASDCRQRWLLEAARATLTAAQLMERPLRALATLPVARAFMRSRYPPGQAGRAPLRAGRGSDGPR